MELSGSHAVVKRFWKAALPHGGRQVKKSIIGGMLCAAAILPGMVAHAANPGSAVLAPTILTRGAIAHAFTAPHRRGHTAQAIASPDTFRYWAVTRRTPGSVEVHRDWVDVTYVRAGSARLETGTTVRGDWKTGKGEWRGGHIVRPHVRILRAGDMVVIPAGLAHRIVPLHGKAFEYVTIKVPAQG